MQQHRRDSKHPQEQRNKFAGRNPRTYGCQCVILGRILANQVQKNAVLSDIKGRPCNSEGEQNILEPTGHKDAVSNGKHHDQKARDKKEIQNPKATIRPPAAVTQRRKCFVYIRGGVTKPHIQQSEIRVILSQASDAMVGKIHHRKANKEPGDADVFYNCRHKITPLALDARRTFHIGHQNQLFHAIPPGAALKKTRHSTKTKPTANKMVKIVLLFLASHTGRKISNPTWGLSVY